MTFNVNRQVQDAFYRYKMPKLLTKIEGKGNGIKTVVVNMADVAKALGRHPALPTKYFGVVLGAQVKTDDKNDRYIVNGAHQSDKLQETLDGFIKAYVLCPECQNPETALQVAKQTKLVQARCKACGHQYTLKSDRITQFVLKNPPRKEDSKAHGQAECSTSQQETATAVDDTVEQSNPEAADSKCNASDDEVVWRLDTSELAAVQRQGQLSEAMRNMTLDVSLSALTTQEKADLLLQFIKDRSKEVGPTSEIPVEVAVRIKKEADRLHLDYRSVLICIEALLDNPRTLESDVKRSRNVFVRFTRSNAEDDQPEKAQMAVLDCMQKLVEKNPFVLDSIARLVHAFYDNDIVEEDNIVDWFKTTSARRSKNRTRAEILQQVKKFVEWLETAEEESSDEDEDDSDNPVNNVENGSTQRPVENGDHDTDDVAPLPAKGAARLLLDEGSDDDLNINDI